MNDKYGKYIIASARLRWIDFKGCSRMRQGNAFMLAKHLERLRCEAVFELLDGTPIGGCQRAEGCDDKRIKWQWWYDKTAIFTDELIGGRS